MREQEAIRRTREECKAEEMEHIRDICDRYDESIEMLFQRYKELEDKYVHERRMHLKLESDFRLLQADYKRFMNYTQHYNSDYMMKLRHIGFEVIEDKEYDKRLDEKIELVDLNKYRKMNFQTASLIAKNQPNYASKQS